MPFDWMHPKRVARPGRRSDVYRTELKDRAALLFRLCFSRNRTMRRLRANVRWDFEVGGGPAPVTDAEIKAIVSEIYQRGGPGAGSPGV